VDGAVFGQGRLQGVVEDLVFSTLAIVNKNLSLSVEDNQEYLNNIEAWWIHKYIEEGFDIMNVTRPRITLEYLRRKFDAIVSDNALFVDTST
jgi:hypothetical protein